MAEKMCFFIGHRDAPAELLPLLMDAVERHITQYGVTEFIVGRYGCFDRMAAAAVREAKERHPEITLVLLTPYYRGRKSNVPSGEYDATFYPPGMERVPKRFAIVRANEYMLRHSMYLICYCKGYVGNTRVLMAKAVARNRMGQLKIENLSE